MSENTMSTQSERQKFSMTLNTLKYIAIIAMTIDHVEPFHFHKDYQIPYYGVSLSKEPFI